MKDAFDVSNWKESPKKILEKDVQRPSVAKAREAGWWARKFSSQPGNTSVPDYIFGRDGRVFFVEFKRPGGVPTKLQAEEHKRMESAGLTVYVCDNRDLFVRILQYENSRLRWPEKE